MKVGPTDGGADVDMGPVITREHLDRVAGYLDIGRREGAEVVVDGRSTIARGRRRLPDRPERARPRRARRCGSRARRSSGRCSRSSASTTSTQALAIGRDCPYGNGASIFTRSGWAARQFKQHFNAGMIGINVGVPAPMAWFPFTGWNDSFFGDLHIQGTEAIQFYTQQKMTMTRWFESPARLAPRPRLEDGQVLIARHGRSSRGTMVRPASSARGKSTADRPKLMNQA